MALCGKGAVKQCIPQTPFTASDQPDLDDDTIQSLDDASGKKNRTIRILHVEDDPTVAGLIQEIASQEGWELDHCLEGNAALEELAGTLNTIS